MSRARQSTEPVPRQTWSRVVGLGLALAPAAAAAPTNHASEPAGPSFSHVGGFWVLIANRGRAVADRLFRDRFE